MGYVYHGSSNRGLKKLEPRKSTHGTYVYAAPTKEIAVVFSKRCGDDLLFTFGRNNKDNPYSLIERCPHAFDIMFNNSSSLYTLDDSTFKDIHTGFSEVVSDVEVDIINEEYIDNVMDKIKELEKEGTIKIYRYPEKPEFVSDDDIDLLNKHMLYVEKDNKEINKEAFRRILFLHPNLLDEVNKILIKNNQDVFNEEDLINELRARIDQQVLRTDKEQYLICAVSMLANYYAHLTSKISDVINEANSKYDNKFAYLGEYLIKEDSNERNL